MTRPVAVLLILLIIVGMNSAAFRLGSVQAQQTLEGRHVIVISTQLGVINNPQSWIGELDAAYEAMEQLTGGQPSIRSTDGKITILEDPNVQGGGAYSGNPIHMAPTLLHDLIQNSWNAYGDPGFGFLHELGHDFEGDFPGFEPMEGQNRIHEVFANFLVCYAYESLQPATIVLNGKPYQGVSDLENSFYISAANQYLSGARNFSAIKQNNDAYTGLLLRLKNQYGWKMFQEAFAAYRALSLGQIPVTDVDKVQLFVSLLSKSAGTDLSSTFRDWGFPIQSQPTVQSVYLFAQVVDANTGTPIEGASVYWDSSFVGTTDLNGRLQINTTYPPQVHENRITKSGYNDDDGNVSIGPTSGGVFTVRLVPLVMSSSSGVVASTVTSVSISFFPATIKAVGLIILMIIVLVFGFQTFKSRKVGERKIAPHILTKSRETKYCIECRMELPLDAEFCDNCGVSQ